MNTQIEDRFFPDPQVGEATKKQKLLELAKKHSVLRLSAEKGLGLDEAIRVLETYHQRVSEAAFPVSSFGLLK